MGFVWMRETEIAAAVGNGEKLKSENANLWKVVIWFG